MPYITQQVLEYLDRAEDISIIALALEHLSEKDIAGASRVLIAYMDALQSMQQPQLKDYDPRAEAARAARWAK